MPAIIKTLKTKENGIEQSVYPKTVLEAVVNSENAFLEFVDSTLGNKI